MITNLLYLYQIPGLGNSSIKRLLRDNSLLINDSNYIEHLVENRYGERVINLKRKVEAIKEECFKQNISIILNKNRSIPDYPLILFIKGNKELLYKRECIAIAGTRKPSSLGKKYSREFSSVLYSNGGILISGWAIGCDQEAQRKILSLGGSTISVVPRGIIPKDKDILKLGNHLIVSEYPPLYPLKKYCCVRRNRIIAGLARALYLPEIRDNGGSYYTVDYSLKVGIPVIASLAPSKSGLKRITTKEEFDLYIKKSLI